MSAHNFLTSAETQQKQAHNTFLQIAWRGLFADYCRAMRRVDSASGAEIVGCAGKAGDYAGCPGGTEGGAEARRVRGLMPRRTAQSIRVTVVDFDL
jgi:hypothetical protein